MKINKLEKAIFKAIIKELKENMVDGGFVADAISFFAAENNIPLDDNDKLNYAIDTVLSVGINTAVYVKKTEEYNMSANAFLAMTIDKDEFTLWLNDYMRDWDIVIDVLQDLCEEAEE